MSVMERRLQILLDQHRFSLVENEAKQSGHSIAAVIRTAIDEHFHDADGDARRQDAARRFLEIKHDDEPPAEDWATIKAALDDDVARADLLP